MSNTLGTFCRDRREELGLTLGELARMLGYRNVNKGVRRILQLEREGTVKEDLLVKLAEALGIDLPTIERLMDQDYSEYLRGWEQWVNEPQPMFLVVKLMPAVYAKKDLPAEVTTSEQAEAWACEYARQDRLRVCLVVSRRLSVWIDAEGNVEGRTEATPDNPNMPWMKLPGNRRKFLFGLEESDE